MTILNYKQLATFLGSPLAANGPYTGRAVLTAVQSPTFPKQQYGGPYYGWPSDAVVTWAGAVMPAVTALTPPSAKVGDANFTLHVGGSGFPAGAVILWNGAPVPTTRVSATELTTPVDMALALVPAAIPVSVELTPGLVTNSIPFDLQPASGTATSSAPPSPPPPEARPTVHTTKRR